MTQPIHHNSQGVHSPSSRVSYSVDDFHELLAGQPLGSEATMELVEGEVCHLPKNEQLTRQIRLLQLQIQQHLDGVQQGVFDVRSRPALLIHSSCELKPAIAVFTKELGHQAASQSVGMRMSQDEFQYQDLQIQWVIDIAEEGLNQPHTQRSQLYAQAGIGDYWSVTVAQSEVRTYHEPLSTGYRHCQLLQVGDAACPSMIAGITLQVQESLPLYFLTRTLSGPRAYGSVALPLQILA